MDNYVLDFYCPKQRLAIELDGGQHNEPGENAKDSKRTQRLSNYGIRVIRFWDNQVFENLDGVLQVIMESFYKTPPVLPFTEGEVL